MSDIQVLDNGPLIIKGENLSLKDGAGNDFNLEGKDMLALCRCGASANKPFCDGAHKGSFESKCEAS